MAGGKVALTHDVYQHLQSDLGLRKHQVKIIIKPTQHTQMKMWVSVIWEYRSVVNVSIL